MKKSIAALAFGLILAAGPLFSQSQVGIGTDTPMPQASLEIVSQSSGVLIPRMTTVQRNTNITGLNATHEGLLIYNTTDSEFNYWDGTQWLGFPGGDVDWLNDATPAEVPMDINDNIHTYGYVGIGKPNPAQSLHIADLNSGIQSIQVEDLSQTGDAYNPVSITQANRAAVFVDKATGIMYSEDADRAYWRLDGNSGVVNAGYSSNCPNLITTSMNASGYEYLGTNDNTDFILATNDRERLRVLRDGQFVAYGKGIATPASSPTGCVPAYPVIDAASFYGTDDTYPLNAYSENVPAVYGSAWDQSGGLGVPMGVQGVIENYGSGTEGFSANATSGNSIGVSAVEVSLNGWAFVSYGDALCLGTGFGFSDERLKQDYGKLNHALDIVMNLEPHTFKYKTEYHDYGFARGMQYGFMAQDIKEVLPDLVVQKSLRAPSVPKGSEQDRLPDLEEYYALNQDALIPILTRSIQEQQAQIETLQAQNAEIMKRLAALEGK